MNGPYAVTVTDANGCTATSGVSLVSTVGVQHIGLTNSEFVIAPNPTQGAFTVRTVGAGTLTLLSVDGREINSYRVAPGSTLLDLPTSLTPGMYMCRFDGDNGSKANVKLIYEPK